MSARSVGDSVRAHSAWNSRVSCTSSSWLSSAAGPPTERTARTSNWISAGRKARARRADRGLTVGREVGDRAGDMGERLHGRVSLQGLDERLDAFASQQAGLELVVAKREVGEGLGGVFPNVLVVRDEQELGQHAEVALLVLQEAGLVAV